MSASILVSAGNGVGGDSFGVPGNLRRMSEIQQQLSLLSRQIGQLASRLADSERQRAKEAANATAMQAAQRDKKERRKGRKVQEEWNARCLPCSQSRTFLRENQVLLLQAVQLTGNNSRMEQRATLCEQVQMESLIFGGS